MFNMNSTKNGQNGQRSNNGSNGNNRNHGQRHGKPYRPQALNTPFSALQGGGNRTVTQKPAQSSKGVWPQVPRAFVPREVTNNPDGAMQTRRRIYLPLLHSEVMSIASILGVQHRAGDISILDVFMPEAHKDGKPAAGAEGVTLTGKALGVGEHYVVIGVYVLTSGVAFQKFGVNHENKLIRLDFKPSQMMPMIRRAERRHLTALSDLTRLRFEVNTQIRWHEYRRLPDCRFDEHNTDAATLTEFNAREMRAFQEAMQEFGDVAPGTPLEVARQLVAARAASAGDSAADLTDPTFGYASDVVEAVEPSTPFARVPRHETVNA